ncbi:GntR family transcriptional regulator [Streptomyces phaeochromogenes]|uniref:GntR family transcriptional regulator n=1 Tax=Streptomyces phaeochromogenes TaxID=1923 RepID=UPI0036AB2639
MPDLLNTSDAPDVVPPSATERVRIAVRERLERGTYRPGTRIPRECDLAREFGVSNTVVQKALKPLKDDGTLYTVLSRGTYAADPESPFQGSRRACVERLVRQRLEDGTYKPLMWLPTLVALASEFETVPSTVHFAFGSLKAEKLLGTAQGGTYVIDPENPAALPAIKLRAFRAGGSV